MLAKLYGKKLMKEQFQYKVFMLFVIVVIFNKSFHHQILLMLIPLKIAMHFNPYLPYVPF